ncbi:MAG TPA: peptidase M3 [Porphyromonadaceae bacterium]|nr:peptidase M3 [Porphyromonadaceae bacterium]
MNKKLLTVCAMSALLTTMGSCDDKKQSASNPFFTEWTTPYRIPPFDQIKNEHFMPAIEQGMQQHLEEIDVIVNNQEAPTFSNTIEAMDYSGRLLSKTLAVFFNLESAETNDSLQKIAEEISPLLSEHNDKVSMNEKLFDRVKTVYNNRESENLTPEQTRLLTNYYKDFVRSGALLPADKKEQLKAINKEIGLLTLKYSQNVLAENNSFELVVENEADLAGLPESVKAAAAEEAKGRGKEGKWVFTLSKPSMIPFLQYAENRDLREKLYKGYINRGMNANEYNNSELAQKIANLRITQANLLGYKNFAQYSIEDKMAKTPEEAMNLLTQVWTAAQPKINEEIADMQKLASAEATPVKLESWDWWYYAEKVRKAKFDLDQEELRPYFQADSVMQGAFWTANQLYGLTFEALSDYPKYHEDVKAYKVSDADGSHVGVLLIDFFPRAGKLGGAWMDNYVPQRVENGKDIRPVVTNVGNYTKPVGDKPALLSLDDVETVFHEFGHGLHGLLSKVTYPSLNMNVPADFVELPSQVMEHWATHPQVLKQYAKHYQTGEVIPDALIEKMQKAETFNQGFATGEFVAAALLDMNWHLLETENNLDAAAFEKAAMDNIGLASSIVPRYRSTYFTHIFSSPTGYAAGYYSYLWAEVLDADAFRAFEQTGNIFDQNTALSFRKNILEKGGCEDPMDMYLNFRGAKPTPDALLEGRGLK